MESAKLDLETVRYELKNGCVTSLRQLAKLLGHNGLGTVSRIVKQLNAERGDDGVYRTPTKSLARVVAEAAFGDGTDSELADAGLD